MRKKLFTALALMAAVAFGSIIFESASYAQNTNSSTTMSDTNKNMGRMGRMGRRRHRRARRHRRRGGMKKTTGNANQ